MKSKGKPALSFGTALALCLASSCASPGASASSKPPEHGEELDSADSLFAVINTTCPRSGKPVSSDSLAEYRGRVVGFCNTHCRDDFAANAADRPDDREFFDALLRAEPEGGEGPRPCSGCAEAE